MQMPERRVPDDLAKSLLDGPATRYHYCGHYTAGYCSAPSLSPLGGRRPPDIPSETPVKSYDGEFHTVWYWIRGRCPRRGWNAELQCHFSSPSRDA